MSKRGKLPEEGGTAKRYEFQEIAGMLKSGEKLPKDAKGKPAVLYYNLSVIADCVKSGQITREKGLEYTAILKKKYEKRFDCIDEPLYVKWSEKDKMAELTLWDKMGDYIIADNMEVEDD